MAERGGLYDELEPAIAAAGWTVRPPTRQTPDGSRLASYTKQARGLYYDLTLVEGRTSPTIIVSIPDAHAPNYYHPLTS